MNVPETKGRKRKYEVKGRRVYPALKGNEELTWQRLLEPATI